MPSWYHAPGRRKREREREREKERERERERAKWHGVYGCGKRDNIFGLLMIFNKD